MGRHYARQQQRRRYAVAEKIVASCKSKPERNERRKASEYDTPCPVQFQVLHIHLKTCKEHNEVYSHLSEQLETAVTLKYVESVLSYYHARKYHSDQVRNV